MDLRSLLVFCLFGTLTSGTPAKKDEPEFPFPALEKDVIPYDSSTPFYTFDGIDYDALPKEHKKPYFTCYGEFVNCIRNNNVFHIVCIYETWSGYSNHYSLCELELRTCADRMYYGQGLYGYYYADDLAFYQGDGQDCSESQKRGETRKVGTLNVYVVPLQPAIIHYINLGPLNSTVSN